MTLRLVESTLARHGYVTRSFEDPAEALASAIFDSPHVSILDLFLPGVTGFVFVRKPQETENLGGVPVVRLTSRSDREIVLEAIHLGVAGFVVKPFDSDDLVDEVPQVLSRVNQSLNG